MLCCDVLDLLVSIPHGGVTRKDMQEAVDNFLRACLKCWMGWAPDPEVSLADPPW